MYLIIDNTKNLSLAYMTPKLIKILLELNLKYKILSTRIEVNNFLNTSEKENIKGIIISGGPLCLSDELNISSINKNIAIFLSFPNIPILGICFGFQIMASIYGGRIISMNKKKEGLTRIRKIDNSEILNIKNINENVYQCHKDKLIEVPPNFKIVAFDNNENIIQCIESKKLKRYGVQFHPEAIESTHYIIKNFIKICK